TIHNLDTSGVAAAATSPPQLAVSGVRAMLTDLVTDDPIVERALHEAAAWLAPNVRRFRPIGFSPSCPREGAVAGTDRDADWPIPSFCASWAAHVLLATNEPPEPGVSSSIGAGSCRRWRAAPAVTRTRL